MDKILNKDSHFTGILIGLILPVIGFALAFGIMALINFISEFRLIDQQTKLMLIGIAFNLWPIRYYFVKKKYELTGRGILLVTFLYIFVYFLLQ